MEEGRSENGGELCGTFSYMRLTTLLRRTS